MKKKLRKAFALVMAASMIMSMLTLNAGAATGGADAASFACGFENHTHGSGCYQCLAPNKCDEPAHTHDYDSEGSDCLSNLHVHTAACCDLEGGQLVCTEHTYNAEECDPCDIEEHVHSRELGCYSCEYEHEHRSGCSTLTCELQEVAGCPSDCAEDHDHVDSYTHSSDCWEITCGYEEHTCTSDCLICTKDPHTCAPENCNVDGCGKLAEEHHVHDAEGAEPCPRHSHENGIGPEFGCELNCGFDAGECMIHVHDSNCHVHSGICSAWTLTCNTPVHVHEAKCKAAMKSKVATDLDENKETNVTLTVGGQEETLGVDIVYIMGGGWAVNADMTPNLEGDRMINKLMGTFEKLIGQGTPVNFGMVPFSVDVGATLPMTYMDDQTDLANLPGKMSTALTSAVATYGGENLENALKTACEMLAETELGKAGHYDRQHIVLISSGHTYFFNSGENNDIHSTVPVTVNGKTYWNNRNWMVTRNNNTTYYPIPAAFGGDFDAYWQSIVRWAEADIAAGDCHPSGESFVYQVGQVKTFSWDQWSDENPNSVLASIPKGFKPFAIAAGTNPLTVTSAAHAIGNERAMYEAYEYYKDNIDAYGIHLYPIYAPIKAIHSNGANNGLHTNQYVGHSFMDKLAGGKGKVESYVASNHSFFDDIEKAIVGSTAPSGSHVDDYIGYGVDYNFDFLNCVGLTVGGIEYTMAELEDATEGYDKTYTFTAPDGTAPAFVVDYKKGNGTSTEMFRWIFKQDVFENAPAALTYKLKLVSWNTTPVEETTTYSVYTNASATLYPEGFLDQDFERPELQYTVEPVVKYSKDKTATELSNRKTDVTLSIDGNEMQDLPEGQAPDYYDIPAGSYVTDFIGVGTDFNFDFVGCVGLTANGVNYTMAELETATEGYDKTYTFTAPDGIEPAFVLDYVKGNGLEEEMFRWTFSDSIVDLNSVTLTYTLDLVQRDETPGTHTVTTNQSATLYPQGGKSEDFPIPELNYTIDGGSNDTGSNDTGSNDTGSNDTGSNDTGSNDTGSNDTEGGEVEIAEGDVPLAGLPGGIGGESDGEEEEILDEEVPLAELPMTGDMSALWLALSALSGAGLFLTGKKRKED